MIGRNWPCPLALTRVTDVTGVSGTGLVATGVVWPDGRAMFRWCGAPPAGHDRRIQQVCLFDDVAQIDVVHGHDGATRVQTRDPMAACADLGVSVFGIVRTAGLRRAVVYWGAAFHDGPAVTWRNNPDRPRIETWPAGVSMAWAELRDAEAVAADEVRLAWVPGEAAELVDAHMSHRLYGRTAVPSRRGAIKKSPH